MAIEIDQSGLSITSGRVPKGSRRNVLYLSTGGVIVLVPDGNSTDCPAGWGNGDNGMRFYLYHSLDRETFTKVATINPSDVPNTPYHVEGCVYTDDSIGVMWQADAGGFRYVKVARTGWTVGSEQTIVGGLTGHAPGWVDADLAISNDDVPTAVLYFQQDDGGGSGSDFSGFKAYTRRTSDNTWVLSEVFTLMTEVPLKDKTYDITALSLDGGSPTARPFVVAIGACRAGQDYGVRLYTAVLNETTGNLTGITLRGTYDDSDLPLGVEWADRPRKSYLFRSDTDEFVLGIMTWYTRPRMIAMVGSWDGSDFETVIPASTHFVDLDRLYGRDSLCQTFGSDVLNFISRADTQPGAPSQLGTVNYVARIDRDNGRINWSGHFNWNNNQDPVPSIYLLGGTANNTDQVRHDMVYYHEYTDAKFTLVHRSVVQLDQIPHSVTPADDSTMTSSTPPVSAEADLDIQFPQSLIKIKWQFSTDAGFSSPETYVQDDTHFANVVNTDRTGVYVKFLDVLPSSLALYQGVTWYVRAAMIDQFHGVSEYRENTGGFIVSHPPSAGNLKPVNGQALAYGDDGRCAFSWKFSDSYENDYQTAFKVEVIRNDTGATVLDSGKTSSTKTSYLSSTLSATLKGIKLKWRAKLWDMDDIEGPWSDWASFFLVDPATINITNPTGGSPVDTPRPNIVFEGEAEGSSSIDYYRVSIEQAGNIIYDSDWISCYFKDDYEISHKVHETGIHNEENYTAVAQVRDSNHLEATDRQQFSTEWTPPSEPSNVEALVSYFNEIDKGYVLVVWTDLARDNNFLSWNIYRKIDILADDGTVETEGEEELMYRDYTIEDDYEFRDYFAPSGSRVGYRVTQVISEFGDEVESNNTEYFYVYPISDGYWLIDPFPPEPEKSAFKMSITTADEYTDEYEDASYVIIGKGRHFDRGTHLGIVGQLTVELRSDEGVSARKKKQRIEDLKDRVQHFYLRTPFGDVYTVYIPNIQVSRLAGVGQNEFCTVTIPYSEVPYV